MDSTTQMPPRRSFWRRRVLDPIVALLTQGVTAEKIAQTLAVGTVCSLFPFLGTTTALNLGVGLWLRMNQPILQSLNYLLTPVHLVMIVVYVRIGEWVWRAGEDRFTVGEMVRVFRDETFLTFLQRFGLAGWHAFTAWLLTAPLLFALLYFPLRPLLHRLARRTGTEQP
ncbi:MAG: DUF2062 domain-containing protein [Opitutaceae bacterium]|nr:DUF2062 domain-containing protein [Opitutaceae bacterium]